MNHQHPKIFVIFEFAIPPYRSFIISWLKNNYNLIGGRSGNERFTPASRDGITQAKYICGYRNTKVYLFNPLALYKADTVITTFNLRRVHTWIYIFLFPSKKWIFWGQGVWRSKNFIVNAIRKQLLRMSSGYIVYTQQGKENLLKFGYPEKKISIAFNTLMIPNAELLFSQAGQEYILYFGRLQSRKEIESILPYLKSLKYKLRIVGEGSHKKELKRLVNEYGFQDRVDFFPGTYDPSTIKDHFRGAVCYFSPGHVGLGVVQSFAYGIPVATLNTKDHAPEFEYCKQDNSYLSSSIEGLIDMIRSIAPHSQGHLNKKKYAFDFYSKNLSHMNMINAFSYQIDKCNNPKCGDVLD